MGESENNLQLLRVNHSAKMSEAFELMLSDESLCDVSICCGGKTLKAHRIILAACSTYFKQILSSINGQTQYPIIFVNGIQISDLEAMLVFMYRGEVTIPQTQLPSLIKSAETLGVNGLSQLDPNAQHFLAQNEDENKSRTSSPSDSASHSRKGKKRRKLIQKTDIDMNSDTENPLNNSIEICDESVEMSGNEMKVNEKLAKSKLRSWSQQIALKSIHKDIDESQQMSESEEQHPSQQSNQSNEEIETIGEIDDKQQPKKQTLKENWRQSRARRPPLKFSEYSLTKGIQESKQTMVKTETQKEMVATDEMTFIEVRPPSPRLTRGRSRVHSIDEKVIEMVNNKVNRDDSIDVCLPSTSHESTNSSILLTPITRSRKQTFSPNESKDNDNNTSDNDKSPVKSLNSDDDNTQTRIKAQVKPNISNISSTSMIKWRPKDPELTTTKFAERLKSSPTELQYQYESIQVDGPPVYRCTYCSHSFRSKQNIIDHIRSVHIGSEERYVCPLCNKQFKWKTSLNNHFNQCHPLSRPTPLRHFDKSRKTSL